MEPVFLTLADVLEIHRDQIQRYGGDPNVRDEGLLQSAVAMPAALPISSIRLGPLKSAVSYSASRRTQRQPPDDNRDSSVNA